ncbi:MAG: acyl-CoA dehydrogenase family protein [Myxococcota bacterium]
MISFGPTEEQELIRDTLREFATGELRESARESDEAEGVSDELLGKLWELGLVNAAIPEEFGGGGTPRSPVTNAIVLEELGYGCVSLAAAALAPALFVQPLLDFGTAEQKEEYLPLFTRSSPHYASLALHESSFAFDATNLKTVAEIKGDGWELTGQKRLVPMGDRASHFLVLARGGTRQGLEDLEAFIVPRDAPGLRVEPAREQTMGLRSLPFAKLVLDRVAVPAEARLGGEAGIDGGRLISSCRLGSLALAVGLSRAVMEFTVTYAKERVAFGQPIAQKQAIAFMLAEMQIEVNSMRWLVWKAASQLEHGLDAVPATALAQSYVCRETMKIGDNGVQILGGHGYIREYPVEMWYRNARTLTVLEGLAAL